LAIMSRTIRALKGHGTENDFILIPDLENRLALEGAFVAAICDRRRGVGADGVIRIAPSEHGSHWFMDYRNHDGSLAEMCGNGIRVMARYLVDSGLSKPGRISIDTRDGVKEVDVPLVGDISVVMGEVKTMPSDARVLVPGHDFPATKVDVGNPHAVVFVDSLDDAGALLSSPEVIPLSDFPTGVNVEFVRVDGEREVSMRVFERGAGETRSCGTGTCAVALATAERFGLIGPSSWTVNVPGGSIRVDLDAAGHAVMTGPAVIVAELVVDLDLR
jgi:diaminopimelate epimerase